MSIVFENTLRPDQFHVTLNGVSATPMEVPRKKFPWGSVIFWGSVIIGMVAFVAFMEGKRNERIHRVEEN